MAQIEVILLMFLTICVGHVKSSTTCYNNGYSTTKYCTYGCCGSSGYQYCCNDYSPIYTGYGVGAIAGIVVGSLAGLGILISIIVCCCCHLCRGGTRGQVLQPHTNPAFTVTTATTTTNGTQMPMAHLSPGMYATSYPTFPQMAGGYMPGNAAMNYPYGASPSTNNPSGAPPPSYDNVARK